MNYMPVPTEEVAASISAAIYRVTCPDPPAGTVTQYMFGWHQQGDQWLLHWDMSLPIAIRDATCGDVAAILAGYVSEGKLSQESADAILATVAANVGNTITLADVTPPEFAALLIQA